MNHIKQILEDFSACTHLAVRAFDRFGACLGVRAVGQAGLQCTPLWREAVFRALDGLHADPAADYVLQCCTENRPTGTLSLCFCCFYIDPQMPELGAMAFGPYAAREGVHPYPIRPPHLIRHTVELARIIARSYMLRTSSLPEMRQYGYQVQRAIDYALLRFPADITLEETARALSLSKTYLSRIFRQETGVTFCGYVSSMRIERSKALLSDPAYSMLDIALAVGFASQSYFSRTFRRHMGMTPQEYREGAVRLLKRTS